MSPFKSKAQMRKMFELEKQGKVKSGTAMEWAKNTSMKKLPEKVAPTKGKVGKVKVIK